MAYSNAGSITSKVLTWYPWRQPRAKRRGASPAGGREDLIAAGPVICGPVTRRVGVAVVAVRSGRLMPKTVRSGQDFQVIKVLYQKVRFMSEGWYTTFSPQRSCTKKFGKTHQMVRLVPAREDPDQIKQFRRVADGSSKLASERGLTQSNGSVTIG